MNSTAIDSSQLFTNYLKNKQILIADPGVASRSALCRIFQDFGVKGDQLNVANSLLDAQAQIVRKMPHIVVTEYNLGKRCGLELLQSQRQQYPSQTKGLLFIILTNNNSQTAISSAAEEDVDAFIIKPFTSKHLQLAIMKAALLKVAPPPYLKAIEEGKTFLLQADFDQAEKAFRTALALDPTPTLAYYYLAQTDQLRNLLEGAKTHYRTGLKINRIHYKCLVGFFDLLMTEKRYPEAYEIVRKLSQYFPANPKRLIEILRLAILNQKFEDIEQYYAHFSNMDERDETLINHICAALVICGRHYLNIPEAHPRALELFRKAAVIGVGRVGTLKEIIFALVDQKKNKHAEEFLNRFPLDVRSSETYLICQAVITGASEKHSLAVDQCRKLISNKSTHERVYNTLIHSLIATKNMHAAEIAISDAIHALPEKKAHFEAFIKSAKTIKNPEKK